MTVVYLEALRLAMVAARRAYVDNEDSSLDLELELQWTRARTEYREAKSSAKAVA